MAEIQQLILYTCEKIHRDKNKKEIFKASNITNDDGYRRRGEGRQHGGASPRAHRLLAEVKGV